MPRIAALAVALLLLGAAAPRAQRDAVPPNVDLVEVDVVVVDKRGNPIHGLTQADFEVKEDGDRVALTTFDEVSSADGNQEDDGRLFVLVLDDAGVPVSGTPIIQTIASAFVSSLRPDDEVAVIRLSADRDEPYGDRDTAHFRIANYLAGTKPFAGWITVERTLLRLVALAEGLATRDQRRKAIVCIGSPAVCNVEEPGRYAPREIYSLWVKAVSLSARVNASMYAIVPGRARLRGGGMVDFTGGELFATTYDVGPAIDSIIRDAGNYYVLGYWPTSKARDLHSLSVKVTRGGAKVHVRRQRG